MYSTPLSQRIIEYKRIPNWPTRAHHLLHAFTKDDLSVRELAGIIENHPAIAARLIGLANSAWVAPASPVFSVERACMILGLTVVRSVTIGLAVFSPFNSSVCPAFDFHRFWVSSKLVADCTVLLAYAMPTPPDLTFLQTVHISGLLHNLGLLCMADMMPEETQLALSVVKKSPKLGLQETLKSTTDTDFCEVGGLFAEAWGLPQDLIAAIKYHRDEQYQGPFWEYALLVGIAVQIVSAFFRDQEMQMPPQPALEKLNINPTCRQQVFNQLQAKFQETSELAKTLFHAI